MSQDLLRRIERLKKVESELLALHKGNETTKFNYFAGWQLGYTQGKISILEDLIDSDESNNTGSICLKS